MDLPTTEYARSRDGAYIAYQVFGEGDVDLLWCNPWFSHVEVLWEAPQIAAFYHAMARFARVIIFDQRGIGLSDRAKGFPDLDTRMDDLRAVLDAARSERTVLWGGGVDGGALCAMFAATHPERTIALAFWNTVARTSVAPDYQWGDTAEETAEFEDLVAEGWGREDRIAEIMRLAGGPSLVEDEAGIRWTARATRYMASPGDMLAFDQMYNAIDFRSVLPSIHVPTLCLMAPQSDLAAGGYADLAARVAGAKTVMLPGSDQHPPWPYNTEAAVSALRDFITDVRDHEAGLDRVLATVLFTDVVDSTATAAVMGDAAWSKTLDAHHATIRALLARFRGNEVDTAGDGFFATFDGPARAVRCAEAIIESIRDLGIEVRAGVHTGEVQTIGGKAGGIAVAIGARVASKAQPSEVLVSSTVRDLVVGSGLAFEEAGEHELKGVPERWRLYRVV